MPINPIYPVVSDLLPMATVGRALGVVLTYFDCEKDRSGKGVTKTDAKYTVFSADFDKFWSHIIEALLIVNKVDLKLNSAVYADISGGFEQGVARLAGYLK